MIKLFASDMDGTLLDTHHQLNDVTATAIKYLQANGVEFMISTGRDSSSAHRLLAPHNIKCPMINLNGASIQDENGTVIYQRPIKQETYERIVATLTHHDLVYSIFAGSEYYLSDREYYINQLVNTLNERNKGDNVTAAQVEDHIADTIDVKEYHYSEEKPVLKMMVISDDPEVLINYRLQFEKFEDLDVTSSGANNIEITHADAQKGLAIKQYLALRGYSDDEVLTIGDSLNDRSMLQMFPNSYAMDNAPEEIKAIANYSAPNNADNGVAQVIESLFK